MKDYIVLEINSKKETLGSIAIETPNEYLFVNDTDSIQNHCIFEEFIDSIFWLTINELVYEFDKKIDNVYVTFLDNDEELICSVVIDKLKPKRCVYQLSIIDWQASGYTFKFADEGLDDRGNSF